MLNVRSFKSRARVNVTFNCIFLHHLVHPRVYTVDLTMKNNNYNLLLVKIIIIIFS